MFADVLQNRCSKNFRKLKKKTPAVESTLLKRDSDTGALCEIVQIFKNICFYRTPSVAASGNWYTWEYKMFERSAVLWGGRDHTWGSLFSRFHSI